jgi:hypothetical protein
VAVVLIGLERISPPRQVIRRGLRLCIFEYDSSDALPKLLTTSYDRKELLRFVKRDRGWLIMCGTTLVAHSLLSLSAGNVCRERLDSRVFK